MLTSLVAILVATVAQAQTHDSHVDEFVRMAGEIEHLSGIRWARDCEEIEQVVAGLSTESVVALMGHEDPRVRAVAVVAAYVGDRTDALPSIFARCEFRKLRPPDSGKSGLLTRAR